MDFALDFLQSNARLDSPALLSSPFLLVTLGYYGHMRRYEIGTEDAHELRRWLLVANAKGRSTFRSCSKSQAVRHSGRSASPQTADCLRWMRTSRFSTNAAGSSASA